MEPRTTSQTPSRPQVAADQRRRVEVRRPHFEVYDDEFWALVEEATGGKIPRDDDLKPPSGPWITVDDYVHSAGTLWLRSIFGECSDQTLRMHAGNLRQWIDFLVNEQRLNKPDEFASDVFVAADEVDHKHHFLAFKAFMLSERPADQGGPVGGPRWNQILSTVKPFHEWLHATAGVELPFNLYEHDRDGRTVTSTHLSARGGTGSAGYPLAPDFVRDLEQGAQRIDRNGAQHESGVAIRDFTFIQWGLATGMRLDGLANSTIYEVPAVDQAVNGGPLNKVRVPDSITKGQRGSEAWALDHRIEFVRQFITIDRKAALKKLKKGGWRYSPKDAIQITTAGFDGWEGTDAAGNTIKRTWNQSDSKMRRRLVTPDGFPALIWLKKNGAPLSKRQMERIVRDAAKFTHQHVNGNFPAEIHTHDLRHTYACNLAFLFLHRFVANIAGEEYAPLGPEDALDLVAMSMGHTDPATTRGRYLNTFVEFVESGVKVEDITE